MKTKLLVMVALLIGGLAKTQTNVSGGIYSNTTWTLANSPYNVTGNIVVFPSRKLTIQAGVVVNFSNGTGIEVRQSTIQALGTQQNKVTFTSASGSPTPGIWSGIYLNGEDTINITSHSRFDHCIFQYADKAINNPQSHPLMNDDSIVVSNSLFTLNLTGIWSYSSGSGAFYVYNSIFNNNTTGVYNVTPMEVDQCELTNNNIGVTSFSQLQLRDSRIANNTSIGIESKHHGLILRNTVRHNGVGFKNDALGSGNNNIVLHNYLDSNGIGMQLGAVGDSIACNHICGNTTHDLEVMNSHSHYVANNHWCTPDSATTAGVIHDGYDNIALGLATFMPIDTMHCYKNIPTAIEKSSQSKFTIYPNPTEDRCTIKVPLEPDQYEVRVLNTIGQTVTVNWIGTSTFSASSLKPGVYLVEVRTDKERMVGRLLVQ